MATLTGTQQDNLFSYYLELRKKGEPVTSSDGKPSTYRYDKITDYKINSVVNTSTTINDNIFKFTVSDDILPMQANNDWVAGNGVLGNDGWIIRKVALFIQHL